MPATPTVSGREFVASGLNGGLSDPTTPLHLHLYESGDFGSDNPAVSEVTECSFSGYAPKSKTLAENGPPSITAGEAYVRYGNAPQMFTASGTGTIRGWYITNAADGTVYFFEKYDTPVEMDNGSVHSLIVDMVVGKCGG